MDPRLKQFADSLQKTADSDKQYEILQSMRRVVGSNGSKVTVEKDVFDHIVGIASTTAHTGVRSSCVMLLQPFLCSGDSAHLLMSKELVSLCINLSGELSLVQCCVDMMIAVQNTENEEMIDFAVRKGLIDMYFRTSNVVVPQELREQSLEGLRLLAEREPYAKQLHEKDIWTHIYRIFDSNGPSKCLVEIVKNIVQAVGVPEQRKRSIRVPGSSMASKKDVSRPGSSIQSRPGSSIFSRPGSSMLPKKGSRRTSLRLLRKAPDSNGSTEEEMMKEEELQKLVQDTKNRLSRNISRAMGSGVGGHPSSFMEEDDESVDSERETPDEDPDQVASISKKYKLRPEEYSAEEGLLNDQYLDESTLDLPEQVCLNIDRKGIVSMALGICQTQEAENLACLCLSIFGLMTPTMHKVISRDKRIIIVRVLLNLLTFISDRRQINVCFLLDLMLKEPCNRSIVLKCGAAQVCATTGNRLLERKDQVSHTICKCLIQLLYHISTIRDGPCELSNHACISFMVKSMKNIASLKLRKNHKGKDEWSGSVEVIAVLTLINVALESPVLSSVTENSVHKALADAAKRTDELGLLAIVGAAFLVGKSSSRKKSREVPRLQPQMGEKIVELLENSLQSESSLGGINWSTEELLQAIAFLANAPYNLSSLRVVLPVVVEILGIATRNDDSVITAFAVEVLLCLSYNMHIMKDMIESFPELHQLLSASLPILPFEFHRNAETLLISLDNEKSIQLSQSGRKQSTVSGVEEGRRTSLVGEKGPRRLSLKIKDKLASSISGGRLSLSRSLGSAKSLFVGDSTGLEESFQP